MSLNARCQAERAGGLALRLLPVVGLGVILPTDAFAYIDAGSTSILFQAAAASLFTGLFLLKTYWAGLRAWVARLGGRSETAADSEDT